MGRRIAALALAVFSLVGAAQAQLDQSGIYRSPVLSPIGSSPTAGMVGDYNRDGVLDVVVTNAGTGGNSVVVAIGFMDPFGELPPDGTLSNFPALPVGSFPADLVTGRFDGDDIDDIVVANLNDAAVVFLHGTGTSDTGPDGRRFFSLPSAPIEVGNGPRSLAVADMNDDGDLDLAVANEGSDGAVGTVSILLGGGDGTFARVDQDPNDVEELVNDLPAGLGTRRVAIGEVSGDGILDVLALNVFSGTVSVFFGNGDGTFAPGVTQSAGGAADFALGDLDGDGALDMVTVENNSDQMSVRLGAGNGTFGAATSYATGTAPIRVLLTDFDGDGELDAFAANSRSQDVTYFAGVGDGTFGTARTYVADAEPRALAVADMDADGRQDVIVFSEGGDSGATAAVLSGREDGLLQAPIDIAAGGSPSGFAVGDVDNDAIADLVSVTDSGSLLFFRANGSDLDDPVVTRLGGSPRGVVLVDINRDKRLDVAISDLGSARVLVSTGDGKGGFAPPSSYTTGGAAAAITAGFFNSDTRIDLAVTAESANLVSVLLQNSSGGFDAPRNVNVGERPIAIATVDANCDGRDDVAVANFASGTISILTSSSNGTMSTSQVIPVELAGAGPASIGVADLNSDGMADLAISNSGANGGVGVRLFRGRCDGTFESGGTLRGAGDIVSALVTRDVTGDQIFDISVNNQTSNTELTFIGLGTNGSGTGMFGGARASGVNRMPQVLASADFDSDGRYDIAVGNTDASSNNVTLLLNCARDPKCHVFGFAPAGEAARRGDANDDGILSAADIAAVAAEVIDGDGKQVEDVETGFFAGVAGADANGDGRVDEQDTRAVARRLFAGS